MFSGSIGNVLTVENLENDDIEDIKNILIELDSIGVNGVFFYDLAVLELKRELNLKLDLVWNYFHITFNLNYPFVPPDSIIQIGFQKAPENLEIWNKNDNKPIKMEYKKNKKMVKNKTEIMIKSLTCT